MKSVFISHSWHDKPLAREIAGILQRLGSQVWLDDAEIKLGDSLVEKIRDGIDSVDYVIALLSKHSVASSWVSKELDVAMNQEIAGRRVKVLPILASKCDLPGFLVGKLYADMSSPRAMRNSLPILLDRLEAPADAIASLRGGMSHDDLEDASWVAQLISGLESENPSTRYAALKAAPGWRGKTLLANLDAIERIFAVLDGPEPTHFKLRALELLAGTEDKGFSYRVEPLLKEEDPYLVAAAVGCLAKFGSDSAALTILRTLRDADSPQIQSACLAFFAKVDISDEASLLSLLGVCERLRSSQPTDEGLRLSVLKAYANQLESRVASSFLPHVLEALTSDGEVVQVSVLESILDLGEDFYFIDAPDLQHDLDHAISHCWRSSSPRVAAVGWVTWLLAPRIVPGVLDRRIFWEVVQTASEQTLQCWFERLDAYRLRFVFDEPEDVAGLAALLGKADGLLDTKILDAICEVGAKRSLTILAQAHYNPTGWSKIRCLRHIAMMERWDPQLAQLLDAALEDLPVYSNGEGEAWALLAKLKSGRASLEEVLRAFPKSFDGRRFDATEDRRKILKVLRGWGPAADPKLKRRLARLAKKLDV